MKNAILLVTLLGALSLTSVPVNANPDVPVSAASLVDDAAFINPAPVWSLNAPVSAEVFCKAPTLVVSAPIWSPNSVLSAGVSGQHSIWSISHTDPACARSTKWRYSRLCSVCRNTSVLGHPASLHHRYGSQGWLRPSALTRHRNL